MDKLAMKKDMMSESGDVESKMQVLKELHEMAMNLLEGDLHSPMEDDMDYGMDYDMKDKMMDEYSTEDTMDYASDYGMKDKMMDSEYGMKDGMGVSVSAEDEEGLEEGLSMAKKMLKKKKNEDYL